MDSLSPSGPVSISASLLTVRASFPLGSSHFADRVEERGHLVDGGGVIAEATSASPARGVIS